jgi:hypothetical protein
MSFTLKNGTYAAFATSDFLIHEPSRMKESFFDQYNQFYKGSQETEIYVDPLLFYYSFDAFF